MTMASEASDLERWRKIVAHARATFVHRPGCDRKDDSSVVCDAAWDGEPLRFICYRCSWK
jgi:hypothetical protein